MRPGAATDAGRGKSSARRGGETKTARGGQVVAPADGAGWSPARKWPAARVRFNLCGEGRREAGAAARLQDRGGAEDTRRGGCRDQGRGGVQETLDIVRAHGRNVVGIAMVVDRSKWRAEFLAYRDGQSRGVACRDGLIRNICRRTLPNAGDPSWE